jgi:hypothetical protein
VASSEVDIEPCDQRVNEVVTASMEGEWRRECEIRGRASIKIQSKDGGRIRDNSLNFDRINKRLSQSGLFERGVVESVDIVPDCCKRVRKSSK